MTKSFKSGTSFSMPFGGTEIWFAELSGMGKEQERIRRTIGEQADVFAKSQGRINVAVNLIETQLDGQTRRLLEFVLVEHRTHIKKLAIVGARFLTRTRLGIGLGKHRRSLGYRYGFFDDYERAKRYLVR